MAILMRFCTLIVNVLCLPLHLMEAVGLYHIYKRIFPICLYRISITYNKKMYERKKELFRSLTQFTKPGGQLTLLEIGCGTGTNFEFYPAGCKVICSDPNPHFEKYLKKSMDENDHLKYERFVVASGEDMGSVEDESVDAVVCTLVLCSVNNIPQTLREAHRILRPGGAFFFMEHVVAATIRIFTVVRPNKSKKISHSSQKTITSGSPVWWAGPLHTKDTVLRRLRAHLALPTTLHEDWNTPKLMQIL